MGGYFSTVAGSYVDESDSTLLLVDRESDVEPAVRELIRIRTGSDCRMDAG